ncbi:hypothetical protein Pcinc_001388 [Petrolisthes cinctipes]|uniref:Uncharacterized protein n=1 Tax=Petrolisthes cinctipes TaxID=88211 RepID=A0AAE1GLD5_PETCI|nr:hypothetical protein Pcinc_001388 [Petrolisthes cinctipes]
MGKEEGRAGGKGEVSKEGREGRVSRVRSEQGVSINASSGGGGGGGSDDNSSSINNKILSSVVDLSSGWLAGWRLLPSHPLVLDLAFNTPHSGLKDFSRGDMW